MGRLMWVMVSLLVLTAGCGGRDDFAELVAVTPTPKSGTPRPTITPAPTLTPTPSLQPTRPTATPSDTPTPTPIPLDETLVFYPFEMLYPSALVRNSSPRLNQPQGSMIPFASSTAPTTIYEGVPDIIVIDLALFNTRRRGQLTVVEYADQTGDIYDAFGAAETEALLKLRGRVGAQRDLTPRSNQIPEAFVDYVNVPGGAVLRGIQYIPPADDVSAVGQDNLFYVAEGVVGEQYYIYFKYPIALSDRPEGIAFDSDSLGTKGRIDQIMQSLEKEETVSLAPGLSLLDEMIASLSQNQPAAVAAAPTATPATPAAATPVPSPTSTPTALSTLTPTTAATAVPTLAAPTTTPQLAPSITPRTVGVVPTNQPNCAHFLVYTGDVSHPDGTILPPNTEFVKTWLVENRGTCHLSDAYTLIFFAETMEVIKKGPVPVILAGEEGQISVVLRTPAEPGTYTMWWQLAPPDDGSVLFQESFGRLFIEIVVEGLPNQNP